MGRIPGELYAGNITPAGNKAFGRKVIDLKRKLGLDSNTEILKFCVHRVWSELVKNRTPPSLDEKKKE